MSWVERARQASAVASLNLVENDSVVGLGSGRTVSFVIKELGKKVKREDLNIKVVPTSIQTEILSAKNGLNLTNLLEHPELDLAIDGADQVEVRTLDLLKGAGGALAREKVVAFAAKKFVIVVDEKKVAKRGLNGKVPVEVLPFGVGFVMREIARIGGRPTLRESRGKLGPVVTDNGNHIIDIDFGRIYYPKKLDRSLRTIPGITETGLFLGLADIVYIGRRDRRVQTLRGKR